MDKASAAESKGESCNTNSMQERRDDLKGSSDRETKTIVFPLTRCYVQYSPTHLGKEGLCYTDEQGRVCRRLETKEEEDAGDGDDEKSESDDDRVDVEEEKDRYFTDDEARIYRCAESGNRSGEVEEVKRDNPTVENTPPASERASSPDRQQGSET